MTRILPFSLLIAASLTLAGCGASEERTAHIHLEPSAEGPFFAGANSLIAAYEVDLGSLIEDRSVNADELHSIRLTSVSVQLKDDLTLQDMNSITLQLVGENAPMATVAVLNPIEGSGQKATLVASDEADLLPYFTESNFTIVLDLDLKEDSYVDQISAELDMEMSVALK